MDTRGDTSSTGQSSSSIALLQERFKKLQKMREMRQERELLNMLESHHHQQQRQPRYQPVFNHTYNNISSSSSSCFQSSSSSSSSPYHRLPSSNSGQISLSLLPDYSRVMKSEAEADYRVKETAGDAPNNKPWLFGASLGGHNSSAFNLDDDPTSDVDTSLHL